MKIAFIGQKGIPAKIEGVEKHVECLASELAKRNHEVFVYVRNNYTKKYIKNYEGAKLIHLPSISTKHLDAISHTFLATMHALFQNYDVIHYQSIGPSSLSFLIKLFRPRVALMATFHGQDYRHQKWGIFAKSYLKFGEYVICRIPDKTIVISHVLGNHIKNKFSKDIKVISNGVSVQWDPSTESLKKWGLAKKGYILSVSRLIRHKGIHYLIEAYKNLEEKNLTREKKLVIVGDGFYTDDYVKYLKALAAKSPNIIFTGTQTGEVLSQLFSHSYLFVQPADLEGNSLALLEAMGYGKTVLASDTPENIESLSDNGFYFWKGNIKNLEERLLQLINKPKIVKETGERAKEVADVEYDWGRIAEKTELVYENVIIKKCNKIIFNKTYGKNAKI